MFESKLWMRLAGLLGLVIWQQGTDSVWGQELCIVAGQARMSDETAERRIHAALEKECQMKCTEAPLLDVFAKIEEEFDINVELDTRALDAVGIGSETPITRDLGGISLRSALQIMLRDLELTWMIQHGTLLITTPEEEEASLLMQIYEVSDLVLQPPARGIVDPGGTAGGAFDALVHAITSTIDPESWDEVGGPGTIQPLAYSDKKVLVVSQTRHAHGQLEMLLDRLRVIKGAEQVAEESDAASTSSTPEHYVQVYPVIQSEADRDAELAELISLAVGARHWNRDETFVRGVAGAVVVRHQADVHRQVRQLLNDLAVGLKRQVGGGFGGGMVGGGGFFSVDEAVTEPKVRSGDDGVSP